MLEDIFREGLIAGIMIGAVIGSISNILLVMYLIRGTTK